MRILLATVLAALAVAAPAAAQTPTVAVPDTAPVCIGVGDQTISCSSGGDQTDPATDPGTVGDGQVISDPSDQIEGGPRSGGPKRGELHVLGDNSNSATASSGQGETAPPASASATVPAEQPAQATAGSASTAAAPDPVRERAAATRSANPKELPFTGINGGLLALCGVALLAGGLALRRSLGRGTAGLA